MPISTVLAGHSHIEALVGARPIPELELRPLAGVEDVCVLDGPPSRDDSFWERLIQEAPGRNIGVAWRGNEHNALYFYRATPEFDFVSRHVPGLKEDAQIVSQAAIADRFRKGSLDYLEPWLRKLREAGARNLALIGGPPPKRDGERLRALLARDGFYLDRAEKLGAPPETVALTDPRVRRKLWLLLQDLVAETARKFDALHVVAPQEAMDEDGFLKEEYWHTDITHANRAYGRLMLAKTLTQLTA